MIKLEAEQEHMTTINDISDLIRILRDDPAWADAVRSVLLSEELLNLPQEVAALTRAFREFAEATNRRLESLEAGQDELRQGQQRLEESQERLEQGQQRLEERQERLEQGQQRLEERQERIEQGQQRLEERQERLEQGQAQLQTTVNGMRGELGNLSGSFYQRRAANFAARVARRDFHLRQTTQVHHADQIGDSALRQMLDAAAEDSSRDFTEDDAAPVEQADAIIVGRAPDGTEVYLLVEASVTIAKGDVDRAKDGAELLQRAVGATTHALVIGETITGEARAQAMERNVAFAPFTPKRYPAQDLQTSQEN